MKNKKDVTCCRSQEGVVVGLVDALLSICRVLPKKIEKLKKKNFGELSDPVIHALQDLTQDEDFLSVAREVHSRYIISEERADIFEAVVNLQKEICPIYLFPFLETPKDIIRDMITFSMSLYCCISYIKSFIPFTSQ